MKLSCSLESLNKKSHESFYSLKSLFNKDFELLKEHTRWILVPKTQGLGMEYVSETAGLSSI